MLAPGRTASRVPAREGAVGKGERAAQFPGNPSITSDNICHIKSVGVGADWRAGNLSEFSITLSQCSLSRLGRSL